MRLVAKHAQVGYQTPGERPGCRNCAHFEQVRHDSPIIAPRQACTKHDIEVTSGGICHDHKLQRQVGQAEVDYRARQLELSCSRLDELQSFIPQDGECRA
jgi:hypothetical protein